MQRPHNQHTNFLEQKDLHPLIMAFLYSNENFPLPVVDELRKLGHDIITIQETGKSGQSVPDEAVLGFAISNERR